MRVWCKCRPLALTISLPIEVTRFSLTSAEKAKTLPFETKALNYGIILSSSNPLLRKRPVARRTAHRHHAPSPDDRASSNIFQVPLSHAFGFPIPTRSRFCTTRVSTEHNNTACGKASAALPPQQCRSFPACSSLPSGKNGTQVYNERPYRPNTFVSSSGLAKLRENL